MNKRIRKKIHKRYINDLCYEISNIDSWRDLLIASDYNKKFALDKNNSKSLDDESKQILRKYDLKYSVSKIEPSEAKSFLDSCNYEGIPIKYDDKKLFLLNLNNENQEGILFKMEADEFESVFTFSLNLL